MCFLEMFLYVYVFFMLFFVFKQKTAYEMRISDWSSDVCSSDLLIGQAFVRRDEDVLVEVLLQIPLSQIVIKLADVAVHDQRLAAASRDPERQLDRKSVV